MAETGDTSAVEAVPSKATRSPVAVRPWMGCLASLVLALLCLCPTWTLLWLGLRGEMVLNASKPGEVRVWVVRAQEDSALAVSTMRAVRVAPGLECLQTRVRFVPLALSPAPAPAVYCSCAESDGGSIFHPGACLP